MRLAQVTLILGVYVQGVLFCDTAVKTMIAFLPWFFSTAILF